MEKTEYFLICLAIVSAIILIYLFNRIRRGVLAIFGGSVDKVELAGIIFTGFAAYMIWKEANREHEWHLFNEISYLFVFGAALTGLGLGRVLEVYKEVKLKKSNESTTESES